MSLKNLGIFFFHLYFILMFKKLGIWNARLQKNILQKIHYILENESKDIYQKFNLRYNYIHLYLGNYVSFRLGGNVTQKMFKK